MSIYKQPTTKWYEWAGTAYANQAYWEASSPRPAPPPQLPKPVYPKVQTVEDLRPGMELRFVDDYAVRYRILGVNLVLGGLRQVRYQAIWRDGNRSPITDTRANYLLGMEILNQGDVRAGKECF